MTVDRRAFIGGAAAGLLSLMDGTDRAHHKPKHGGSSPSPSPSSTPGYPTAYGV